MTYYKPLKTERLSIRPVVIEDAPFILELMNTPKWLKNIGDRNVNSVEEAETYITEKAFPQFEKYGYTNNVVIRKVDHHVLGTCGLYHREGMDSIDIGFAFLPDYEGKGYAFEATNRLLFAANQEYGITALSGYTLEANTSSRQLLERLGFNLLGIGKLPNNEEELLHYHRVLDF